MQLSCGIEIQGFSDVIQLEADYLNGLTSVFMYKLVSRINLNRREMMLGCLHLKIIRFCIL